MNAYSRTLALSGATRVGPELREAGSSALDRRTTWPAPDPTTMLFDPWGAPAPSAVIRTVHAPWPAPDASMRRDMAPPVALAGGVVTNLVEPFHPIEMPDLAAARRVAVFDPPAAATAGHQAWPPPAIAGPGELVWASAPATQSNRSGSRHRLAFGLVAAAGAMCAAVAAAVVLL